MSRQQFRFESTGTLAFHPSQGRADAAASLTIFKSKDVELATAGSWPETVALDTVDTSLSVAALKGARQVTLASGTGVVVGRHYLIGDSFGREYEVRVEGVDGNDVKTEQPLRIDIASAFSTFKGHDIRFALDATHLSEREREVRAVWTYAVGGDTFTEDQVFDIVRQPFQVSITEEDIERVWMGFGEAAARSNRWKVLIEGARNTLDNALRSRQVLPDLVRNPDALRLTLVYMFLSMWEESRFQTDRADMWRKRLDTEFAAFMSSHEWYDVDDDLNVDDGASDTRTFGTDEVGRVWNPHHHSWIFSRFDRETMGAQMPYAKVG